MIICLNLSSNIMFKEIPIRVDDNTAIFTKIQAKGWPIPPCLINSIISNTSQADKINPKGNKGTKFIIKNKTLILG